VPRDVLDGYTGLPQDGLVHARILSEEIASSTDNPHGAMVVLNEYLIDNLQLEKLAVAVSNASSSVRAPVMHVDAIGSPVVPLEVL
jgi:hypothetical protein